MHTIKDRYSTKILLSLYTMNIWHFVFPEFAYILLNYNIAKNTVNVIISIKSHTANTYRNKHLGQKTENPFWTPMPHTTWTSIFNLNFAFDKHLINFDYWILTWLMYFYWRIGVSLLCFNFLFSPISWVVCI